MAKRSCWENSSKFGWGVLSTPFQQFYKGKLAVPKIRYWLTGAVCFNLWAKRSSLLGYVSKWAALTFCNDQTGQLQHAGRTLQEKLLVQLLPCLLWVRRSSRTIRNFTAPSHRPISEWRSKYCFCVCVFISSLLLLVHCSHLYPNQVFKLLLRPVLFHIFRNELVSKYIIVQLWLAFTQAFREYLLIGIFAMWTLTRLH